MRTKVVVVALLIGFSPLPVFADIGPKPTMHFDFSNVEKFDMSKTVLLQCKSVDCSDAQPLRQLGPQGFSCYADKCEARAYGFAPFSVLQMATKEGRTIKSNVFDKKKFSATYFVSLSESTAVVTEK